MGTFHALSFSEKRTGWSASSLAFEIGINLRISHSHRERLIHSNTLNAKVIERKVPVTHQDLPIAFMPFSTERENVSISNILFSPFGAYNLCHTVASI